jgi:DNA-binding winged helix-turn-helix (wHTH) protein
MPPNLRLVQFGAFEVDLERRELRRSGLKVRLQDQPFQLLAALLERPGELVTRDKLREELWPADTFVDFDHRLNAAVKRLRDALGDDPDNPRFIQTMPRRGYRFIAGVVTAESPQRIPHLPRRAPWVVLAAVGVLVLVAAEVRILPLPTSWHWGDWALRDRGIYYVDESGPRPAIQFFAFATHKITRVAEVGSLPRPGDPGFAVSPYDKRLIFSQVDRSAVDLMLVESFR